MSSFESEVQDDADTCFGLISSKEQDNMALCESYLVVNLLQESRAIQYNTYKFLLQKWNNYVQE
jgi:hypothetical protein